MDVGKLRASHPLWHIDEEPAGTLWCQYGAWRFRARNPVDAHAGIMKRETPMTVEELGRRLAQAGF